MLPYLHATHESSPHCQTIQRRLVSKLNLEHLPTLTHAAMACHQKIPDKSHPGGLAQAKAYQKLSEYHGTSFTKCSSPSTGCFISKTRVNIKILRSGRGNYVGPRLDTLIKFLLRHLSQPIRVAGFFGLPEEKTSDDLQLETSRIE